MHNYKRELAALTLLSSSIPMSVLATDAATSYPQSPITLVVGYSAGGGVDTLARLLARHMADELGEKVVVENRPGAASNIAAESVARSTPDGYTLYISTHPSPTLRSTSELSGSSAINALVPVSLLATVPNVVVTSAEAPIASIKDLIALAKANPKSFNLGSPGAGSPPHLLGELFLQKTGTDALLVPYRGGAPAIPDVIGRRLDALFISLPGALPHIQAGTVRALAIMSKQRALAVEKTPTMEEAGVRGIDLESRFGLMAPAGTPPEVITRLNESINAVLENSHVRGALAARGYVTPAETNTPETFEALIAMEADNWRSILLKANTQPDAAHRN